MSMRGVESFLLEEEGLARGRENRRGRSGGVSLPKEAFPNAVAAPVEFLFGKPVLKSDVEAAFSAEVDGVLYRAVIADGKQGVQGVQSPDGLSVAFIGRMVAGKKTVGVWRRTFSRLTSKKLVATHDLLQLEDTTPPGVGTALVRNTVIWEKSMDVASVSLHAEWVGRYVWASAGWGWADNEEFESKRRSFKEFLSRRIGSYQTSFSTSALGAVTADYESKRQGLEQISGEVVPKAWELASFQSLDEKGAPVVSVCPAQRAGDGPINRVDVGPCGAGKAFLLSSDSWYGILRLRDGDPGWARCRKRLRF